MNDRHLKRHHIVYDQLFDANGNNYLGNNFFKILTIELMISCTRKGCCVFLL